jgi:hypothetical protein
MLSFDKVYLASGVMEYWITGVMEKTKAHRSINPLIHQSNTPALVY